MSLLNHLNARVDWIRLLLLERGIEINFEPARETRVERAQGRIVYLEKTARQRGVVIEEPRLLREEHVDLFLAHSFAAIDAILNGETEKKDLRRPLLSHE